MHYFILNVFKYKYAKYGKMTVLHRKYELRIALTQPICIPLQLNWESVLNIYRHAPGQSDQIRKARVYVVCSEASAIKLCKCPSVWTPLKRFAPIKRKVLQLRSDRALLTLLAARGKKKRRGKKYKADPLRCNSASNLKVSMGENYFCRRRYWKICCRFRKVRPAYGRGFCADKN